MAKGFDFNLLKDWFYRNSPALVRQLVVIGVLVFCFFLAPRIAYQNALAFLTLIVWPAILGGLILLHRPELGFPGLIVASLLIPFKIGTGTQTNLNAAVLLLLALIGLWIVDIFISRRTIRVFPSRPQLPLFLLLGSATISLLFGQLIWFSLPPAPIRAQLGQLVIFFLSAGAFLLAAYRPASLSGLKWMTWAFICLGGVYMGGRLLPVIGAYINRLYLPGTVGGSLFWVWLVALASGQALFNQDLAVRWRLALGLVVLGIFYISLGEEIAWTSGWAPALTAIGVIAWFGFPKLRIPALVLAAMAALFFLSRVTSAVMVGDNQYSLSTRLAAWSILAKIIEVNPFFGVGPANYYWYTPLFSIMGYYVQFNSHNNYIDLIAQIGLVGLACFLWFAVETGRVGLWLRHQVRDGFARGYVYACLGGLVGTLVAGMLGDWILPFVYNIGFDGFQASMFGWLFPGGLVALERLISQTDSAISAAPL